MIYDLGFWVEDFGFFGFSVWCLYCFVVLGFVFALLGLVFCMYDLGLGFWV